MVVGASALLAVAIVDPRFQPLLVLPVGLAGLWAVARFPFAATCALVALSASIIEPGRFKASVGPLDLRLTEMLLGALLLVALFRPARNRWGGFTGGALLTFFAVLVISALLSLGAGRVGPVDAYHYSRTLAPLLFFFVIVRLFPEPTQIRRLLYVAAVLAAVTGIVSLLSAAPGSPVSDVLNPSGGTDADIAPPPSETTGMGLVKRVRLPGVALAYVLFWYAALQAMRCERTQRLAWLAMAGGMSLTLALSFNRNMWLGLVFGAVLIFAVTHARARRQFVVGALVVAMLGTLVTLSGLRVGTDSPLYPLVARVSTIFQPEQEARDSSLTDRFYENRYALEAIRENPVVGVGPGAPYGLTDIENLGDGVFQRKDALFLHNQYFHLLLIAGPLALLSFLAFLLSPVLTGWARLRRDETFVALAVAVAITLLSAIVMISFVDATWGAVLGLMVGSLTVLASPPSPAPTSAQIRR